MASHLLAGDPHGIGRMNRRLAVGGFADCLARYSSDVLSYQKI
ncbi:hypothetical protein PHO31112_00083 [Pandoraea horticolens]|uniref:Uncharacterized protein n=1 Tax=Pandoraea horticolens TaxID=2508298 RepID=A0A5E4RAW2_9BURK|nr:hypothetical protein PHO31112_00083 [Pandoraea horticolens]